MVTKIRWSPAAGTVAREFDDVLVLASQTLSGYLTEELEPWDLQNVRPYQEEYLSGFRSEMYQLDPAQGFDRARQLMARTITVDVARAIGGDQQQIARLDTRYGDIRCKHILLPICPDGRTFATGSWDNTARIWDTQTGTPIGWPLPARSTRLAESVFPTTAGASVCTRGSKLAETIVAGN